MNILLATSSIILNGGGVSSYAWELMGTFKKNNDIHILTDDEGLADISSIASQTSTLGQDIFSYKYCKTILDVIARKKIDLVINSNSAVISILAPFINIPIVTVSHFTDGALAIRAGYNAPYINHIITLSTSAKQYMEKKFRIGDTEKVKIIYNYVEYNQGFHDDKISNNPLLIVYPGGAALKKSPAMVMNTLKRLLKTSLDFRFCWLGGTTLPGRKFSIYKKIDDFFELDKRFLFTGTIKRNEAIDYIQRSNIFLLPSRGEGCAMTLLEALDAGCIPIVSNAPHASREILNAGDFGIVVSNPTGRKIARYIIDIIKNHDKYKFNYRRSFDYAHSHLTREIWQSQMNSLFNVSLLEEKKTQPYTKINHQISVKGYKRLIRKEVVLSKFLSIRYNLYFNGKAIFHSLYKLLSR